MFGSLCYASTITFQRTKLIHRARKCIFLGFQIGIKGYVLFDVNSREIFVSGYVTFHENIMPYKADCKYPSHSTWKQFSDYSQPVTNIPAPNTTFAHQAAPPTNVTQLIFPYLSTNTRLEKIHKGQTSTSSSFRLCL